MKALKMESMTDNHQLKFSKLDFKWENYYYVPMRKCPNVLKCSPEFQRFFALQAPPGLSTVDLSFNR